MIKINDKYYIDKDKYNLILKAKHTAENGNEYYTDIGFFGSLKYLYSTLLELEIKEDLEILNNIGKIVSLIESFKESIKE